MGLEPLKEYEMIEIDGGKINWYLVGEIAFGAAAVICTGGAAAAAGGAAFCCAMLA